MTGGRQIPLDFDHRPALGGGDFLVASPNREAVGWLDRWPDWPAPLLILYGPPGCGKTHLVQVFIESSRARLMTAADLVAERLADGLGDAPAVVLEDAERLLSEGHGIGLFHLYNMIREEGRQIVLTAGRPPAQWAVPLADLRSRLLAGVAVGIGLPDDSLLGQLLVKLLADRQLKVDADVIPYMLARMERSFDDARRLVAEVDRAALAERRNITIPLIRDVLARR